MYPLPTMLKVVGAHTTEIQVKGRMAVTDKEFLCGQANLTGQRVYWNGYALKIKADHIEGEERILECEHCSDILYARIVDDMGTVEQLIPLSRVV